MNRMQWEAAIHRLRQMEERLPEGSFDRLALEQPEKRPKAKSRPKSATAAVPGAAHDATLRSDPL